MAHSNYDDVVDQLRAAGLTGRDVEHLRIGTPKPVRCPVEGDREKRGWYWLHELSTSNNDLLIVGTFGVWRGNDQGTQKVDLRKREISKEQSEALRQRLKEERRQHERERRRLQERAAQHASALWAKLPVAEEHPYLARKSVMPVDARVSPKTGALVIPITDTGGRVHGLQLIRTQQQADEAKRPTKEYFPAGLAKKGHFHMLGAPRPGEPIFIFEGYATTVSAHMARRDPAVTAFDANNLLPVGEALRKRYPTSPLVYGADDDRFQKCSHCSARLVLTVNPEDCPSCGKPHGRINTGVVYAEAAALATGGTWFRPEFPDESGEDRLFLEHGTKHTDFNDLHVTAGLASVRRQMEDHLRRHGLDRAPPRARTAAEGEGEDDTLRPIQSVEELLKRYFLVYAHGGVVFDAKEHILLPLSDMRDACVRRELHRAWSESPDKRIVRIREVGFDPTQKDPNITCNLFGKWPTKPVAGKCELLLELLWHMCSGEANAREVYDYVLRWVAYPIQHPGAKMKSCLVFHGKQGAGKNMFFEAVMSIYGDYGDVIDQSALEDKHNDWASRKLFMLADEVVDRGEVFHLKNRLKGLITNERLRINPKHFRAYWERNHMNLVFMSNESMPVALEESDRRHTVIWTPPAREREFYEAVGREMQDGGIAALHHYLLHLDLGDFNYLTPPIMTAAKTELINLALDSPLRFHDALVSGDIRGLKRCTGLATDWFEAYSRWCRISNLRAAPMPKFINALTRHRDVLAKKERYWLADESNAFQHSILFLGDQRDPPDGQDRRRWLGQSVVICSTQLQDFKEATK